MKQLAKVVLAVLALSAATPSWAGAQVQRGSADPQYALSHSPERVALEFRIGPYRPPLDPALATETGKDRGPLVAGELDVWAYRVPNLGLLGAGLGFGWTRYNGNRCPGADDTGMVPACTSSNLTSEKMSLRLYPLYAVGVLRIDVLARKYRVPLVFSGKAGVEYVRINLDDKEPVRSGAIGFRWGAQIALELDVFDRAGANRLDAEWGINHSYLFFEMYGSTSQNNGFDVSESFAWVAGLGLIF